MVAHTGHIYNNVEVTGKSEQFPQKFENRSENNSIRSHGSVGRTTIPWSTSEILAMDVKYGRKTFQNGPLAQLVEHIVHIDGVTGSSPVRTTQFSHP